ncbi:MAG: hypothetical protein RIQ33_709, partial [Bacteroidota bacterium]
MGNNQFLLRFNFSIPDKHHVFTQHLDPLATGTATEIKFTKSSDYELIGEVKEIGKLLNEPDP